jgi:small-conductance mechanosensitive channel
MDSAFIKAGETMKEGVIQQGFKPIEDAAPVTKQQIMDSIGGGAVQGASKASDALAKIKDDAKQTQSKLSELIRDYTQKSSDQLDAYNQKIADITSKMAQLQSDFAKSTADKQKQYQDEQLQLFMAHQDKLAQSQKDLASLKDDLQKTDDADRQKELQSRITEIQKQLDAEQAIVNQYASLKADAEKFRATTDLERLRLKYEDEKQQDKIAFDQKMAALKADMHKEENEHKKQTERLKEETAHRFDLLLQEYRDGYDKIIAESKAKHAELVAIEAQVQATVQAIQNAQNAIKSAPSGSAAIIPQTHLASGGIVTKPTIALIGESGPEAVIPLRGNSGQLSQPVSVSIMEGATVNVSNQADETRLARTVAKELAKVLQGNRYGLAALM